MSPTNPQLYHCNTFIFMYKQLTNTWNELSHFIVIGYYGSDFTCCNVMPFYVEIEMVVLNTEPESSDSKVTQSSSAP